VLLTGDIEQAAEREMIKRLATKLKSDVLVVPHHGSKTSSSTEFVATVSPDIALFPVGYRNRYGFPKAQIVQRYRDRHVQLFDTARHGAIELSLGRAGELTKIRTYRQIAARYWHDQSRTVEGGAASSAAPKASGRSVTLIQ
jgi:competence protein ComEC